MKFSNLKTATILSLTTISVLLTSPLGIEAARAATKTLSASEGRVEFLAIGKPGFLKVKGEGAKPTGNLKIENGKASGEFTVDLSLFKTGIELRDEHMKEKYLEVSKYPKAILRFTDVDVKEGAAKSTVPAELELHGQKKAVAMEASLEGPKAGATFKIKLSDFGIAIPSYAGITVAEDVTITIDAVLTEAKSL